jgi:hypothetical protein
MRFNHLSRREFATLLGKLPKREPLNQFVPLIEFSFDSPRGEKTTTSRPEQVQQTEQALLDHLIGGHISLRLDSYRQTIS